MSGWLTKRLCKTRIEMAEVREQSMARRTGSVRHTSSYRSKSPIAAHIVGMHIILLALVLLAYVGWYTVCSTFKHSVCFVSNGCVSYVGHVYSNSTECVSANVRDTIFSRVSTSTPHMHMPMVCD